MGALLFAKTCGPLAHLLEVNLNFRGYFCLFYILFRQNAIDMRTQHSSMINFRSLGPDFITRSSMDVILHAERD